MSDITGLVAPGGGMQPLFVLRNADLTLTTDQAFTKLFTGSLWKPWYITANRKTGAFGTACLGGIYTGAAKTGNIIIAAAQSYAALTGALTSLDAALALTGVQSSASLFLSLTTGNTGALTADIFVYGAILD